MLSLAGLTFMMPMMLAALAVIPAIWWLLRVTPPQPRTVRFPGYFLLKDLQTDIRTPSKTPWWLLLIRSLFIALAILGLANPVLKLSQGLPGEGGSVLLVVDNGYASATEWEERQRKIREYLPQISRSDRNVVFMTTAPDVSDAKIVVSGAMTQEDAAEWAMRITPQPWPADYAAAMARLKEDVLKNHISHTVFFSDGTASGHAAQAEFLDTLQSRAGGLTVVRDADINNPVILRRQTGKPGELAFRVERLQENRIGREMVLVAFGDDGAAIDTLPFSFPDGETETDLVWNMLPELRGKVARIEIQGARSASATYLTDARWRQKPVGILADPSQKDNRSFLNEVYYLRRALEGGGAVNVDAADILLDQPLSALVWPDSAALTPLERVRILDWVEQGGFLVRFAGASLAANTEDPLLPVELRYGQRAMEGAMTWEKPLKLGDIPETSPLFGLTVPDDVTVTRQVLAVPSPEAFEKTWLQLDDGTPLVTGGTIGKGAVALVHTTAGPDWSDFCYSGLYVEMLQRMVSLSAGVSTFKPENLLRPRMLLDGFGRLYSATDSNAAMPIDPKELFMPTPRTPPGIYGDDGQFSVFNAGDALPRMRALTDIPSAAIEVSYAPSGEKDLKPDFLTAALFLLLIDTLATFWLRGVFARRAVAMLAVVMLLFSGSPASAQGMDAVDVASDIYLAYVETGDQDTDTVSFNGLSGLARMINNRTTIKIKGVTGVNPDSDDLFYYPFLYWPMTDAQGNLSGTAARNVQNYLSRGGMIVFDTRDGQFGNTEGMTIGTRKLRQLTENIIIPDLATVGDGHILTKSFYLLDSFEGHYAGGKLWVEKEPNPNFDSVTSVIIGGNDWAAAWSAEPSDRSRFMLDGGEGQREMAYRFGINLAMVALAGNYKADQVHIPYILERLKR